MRLAVYIYIYIYIYGRWTRGGRSISSLLFFFTFFLVKESEWHLQSIVYIARFCLVEKVHSLCIYDSC